MKTRLLRKVRKRYSIEYYPNGFKSQHNTIYSECVILDDKKDTFNIRRKIFELDKGFTKSILFRKCQNILIKWILEDYDSLGTRRNNLRKIKEKLWYNGNKKH